MLLLFHTAKANEEAMATMLAELAPEIPTRHVVQPEWLDRALAEGGVSPENFASASNAMRRFRTEADLVLCTCSTIGECADAAGAERIDRPMAQAAVKAGARILAVACVETTLGPTKRLLEAEGAQQVDTLLLREAWTLWQVGDKEGYWTAIAQAILARARNFDCIVLAQASMVGATLHLKSLSIPILSSPQSGLAAAVEKYRKQFFSR